MSIDFEMDGHVAKITINRPEKLNALDDEAYHELSEAWIRVRDDSEIRVAVITGAGDRSFSVGADLKTSVGHSNGLDTFWHTQQGMILNRGLEVWKPVVAAVNGYCLGGGMTLLLATDIRIASEGSTFGLSEVKRGILPGNGGTQRIISQLPYAIAMEILLVGDAIDAVRAREFGLVNLVVSREQLMDTAMAYARRLAANAPLAVQATKEAAIRSRELGWSTGFRIEQAFNQVLQQSEDAKEGPAAFTEKRSANFKGR